MSREKRVHKLTTNPLEGWKFKGRGGTQRLSTACFSFLIINFLSSRVHIALGNKNRGQKMTTDWVEYGMRENKCSKSKLISVTKKNRRMETSHSYFRLFFCRFCEKLGGKNQPNYKYFTKLDDIGIEHNIKLKINAIYPKRRPELWE